MTLFERFFNKYNDKGLFKFVSDETCLKILYHMYFGKKLDLNKPQSFNEKLQWLKLYDRKPEYTKMVDKFEVKEYVSDIIGREHVIPTIGVWDNFDDIDFNYLPEQFVLKCTHDSGGLVIVSDKSKFDKASAKKKIDKCMKRQFFYTGREWPYKQVKPRIIAEQYMNDGSGELKDYKIFVFGGEPKITLVCSERFSQQGLREDFFDENWCLYPFKRPEHPNSGKHIDKPNCYDQMMCFAKKLSKDIPFVRTDFYEINGKVYFGEITFYPASGFSPFVPEEWDYKLGEWLELPQSDSVGYD